MTDATTTRTDKAEPVAWQWRYGDAEWMTRVDRPEWFDDEVNNPRFYSRPLYTHPHPSLSVGLEREAVAREAARRILSVNFDFLAPDMEPSEQREFEDSITNAILALAAPAEGYVLVPEGGDNASS